MKKIFVCAISMCALFTLTGCDQVAGALDNPVGAYLEVNTEAVVLNPDEATVRKATTISTATVVYESSNPEVATVDENGKITGVAEGDAVISVVVPANEVYLAGNAKINVHVNQVLAKAKATDIGRVVCTAGHIHTADADAEICEADRVAMVAYVGNKSNCKTGLAIALTNARNNVWANAKSYVATWTSDYPVAGATWRLPSTDDWQYILIGCGSTTQYISQLTSGVVFDSKGLNDKLNAIGASFLSGYYWSSDENKDNTASAWEFVNGATSRFEIWSKTAYADNVRYCLAF
ncbi:MAG: Ig-like domain-containing protein [Prevotella sp.]|nr:Ig-like domain-containing protein [Prevotella sp.]